MVNSQNTPLRAAIQYAKMGWPVLPVNTGKGGDGKNNKAPVGQLVPNGKLDATTDQATLERWFNGGLRNLAILPPTSVLVLDFDEEGTRAEFFKEWPELATYPGQKTPGGGMHVFMRVPENCGLTATVGIVKGLDLRGLGKSYLVAEPSQYNGLGYEWVVPLVPAQDLPMAPEGLIGQLRGGNKPELVPHPAKATPAITRPREPIAMARLEGMLATFADNVRTTQEGTRHDTLLRQARGAAGLIAHGLPEDRVWEEMTQAGLECGLGAEEIISTVRDGIRDGRNVPLPMGDRERTTVVVKGGAVVKTKKLPLVGTGKTEGNAAREEAPAKKSRQTQLDELTDLVDEYWDMVSTETWTNTEDGLTYVSTAEGDFPILDGKGKPSKYFVAEFKRLLDLPSKKVSLLTAAVGQALDGRAGGDWPEYKPIRRIADIGGALYINALENGIITVQNGGVGWQPVAPEGVKFVRDRNLKPLPVPEIVPLHEAEARLMRIFDYVQVNDVDQIKLLLAIFSWFTPNDGQFWLNLVGTAHAGKSSAATFLVNLINPHRRVGAPTKDGDAQKGKAAQWVIVYDDVFSASELLSSIVNKAATHADHESRKLYTDDVITYLPLDGGGIVTSLDPLFSRQDTNTRVFVIHLPDRAPENIKSITELNEEFEKDWPSILGGLLALLARARELKKDKENTKGLVTKTRMKDAETLLRLALPHLQEDLDQALGEWQEESRREALGDEPLVKALTLVWADKFTSEKTFRATADTMENLIRSLGVWGLVTAQPLGTSRSISMRMSNKGVAAFAAVGVKVTNVKDETDKLHYWVFEITDSKKCEAWVESVKQLKVYDEVVTKHKPTKTE